MTTDLQNSTGAIDAPLVQRKLRKAWRKQRRFCHFRGICHMLLWLVAMVLLDFLVDWLFRVPAWARLTLLGLNLAVLAVVFYFSWFRRLEKYDPVRVALQVENRHPELKSLLVSFVQINQESQAGGSASPALIAAFRRQTIEATRPIDFREIIRYGDLKRILAFSAVVTCIFAAASVNWSDFLQTLVARMMNPNSQAAYPTRTIINDVTGDVTVKQGSDVTLIAHCGGVTPAAGKLFIKTEDATRWDADAATMLPDPSADSGGREYKYTFSQIYKSFRYYVKVGDSRSQEFQVTVLQPPKIVKARLTFKLPDYTQQFIKMLRPPAENLNQDDLPRGTELEWELHMERPLTAAKVCLPLSAAAALTSRPTSAATTAAAGGSLLTEVPLEVSQDGMIVRWKAKAGQSFTYRFKWKDSLFDYDDEVTYSIAVRTDRPPKIEIVQPSADEKATVNKTVNLSFRAEDDYGITAAWIIYSLNNGEEVRKPIEMVPAQQVAQTEKWALAKTIPDIKEGDILIYRVEAANNRPGTPQIARSVPRQVEILSVPEYLAWMATRSAGQFEEMNNMKGMEEATTQKLIDVRAVTSQPTKGTGGHD